MPEAERTDHIAIEEIADYLEGTLPEERSRAVRDHLERCVPCGLEAKRLERFARIDADTDLTRKAEWPYARGKLEKAYKEGLAQPKTLIIEVATPPEAHLGRQGEKLVKLVPGSRLATVEHNAGGLAVEAKAEELARLTLDFLKG